MKSVFRQKEYEKRYYVSLRNNEHWTVGAERLIQSCKSAICLSDKEVGSYEIELPKLEVGEKFFLNDVVKEVTIQSVLRSSDGSITYYIEDILIETEESKTSLKESKEELLETRKLTEELNKTIGQNRKSEEQCHFYKNSYQSLKEEHEHYEKTHPYRHRFFNRKRHYF